VIAENLPAKTFDRNLYLRQLVLLEWRGRVSMLAKTPEQFHGAVSSLYLDVALDGQILYDPPNKGGILKALRRSPLVGADLNLKRPVLAGRKVDL
jgi:hypothetical protein